MANKLSAEKVNKLWLAWQEKQSIRYVVQKCHVSKKTVARYRLKENWGERIAKIKQLTSEMADMKQAEQNAKFIRIAESTINLYAQSLTKVVIHTCPKCGEKIKMTVPRTTITPNHFDKMVRLIRQEFGGPDSEVNLDAKNRFVSFSELDLSLEVRKKILKAIRAKTQGHYSSLKRSSRQ